MQDISIYIHWPFCKKKCPYCDFNSHVQESIDHQAWCDAYLNQIDYFQDIINNKKIKSIFFGGGTPSLMKPFIVEKIIDKLSKYFHSNVEITLEANPTSFEKEKFKEFKSAGINRVSIGIQSFIESDLKFLGREHSLEEAKDAITQASNIFNSYSFDLIYARPKQTLDAWVEELNMALKYAGGHISLYQLTIEKGTPFYVQHRSKEFTMPTNSNSAKIYKVTNDILKSHGFNQYEISNYAKPGNECVHNMTYWQYKEFLGIGPGAHSRVRLSSDKLYNSLMMHYKPDKWMSCVKLNGNAIQQNHKLTEHESVSEYILMGLRLDQGISFTDFEQEFGINLKSYLDFNRLKYFKTQNLLEFDDHIIKINEAGKILLDYIVSSILNKGSS